MPTTALFCLKKVGGERKRKRCCHACFLAGLLEGFSNFKGCLRENRDSAKCGVAGGGLSAMAGGGSSVAFLSDASLQEEGDQGGPRLFGGCAWHSGL